MDYTVLLYDMSVNFLYGDLKVGETVRLRSPVVLSNKLSITHGNIKKINVGRRGKTYDVYIGHEQEDLKEVVRSRLWKVTDLDDENNAHNENRNIKSPSRKGKEDNSNCKPVTPSSKDNNDADTAPDSPARCNNNVDDISTDQKQSLRVGNEDTPQKSQEVNQASTTAWSLPPESYSSSSNSSLYMPDMWFSTYSSVNATETVDVKTVESPQDKNAIDAPEYIDTVYNDEVEVNEDDHNEEEANDHTSIDSPVKTNPGQKRKQTHEGSKGNESSEPDEYDKNQIKDASPKAKVARTVLMPEKSDAVDDQDNSTGSSSSSNDDDSDSGSDSDSLNCLTGTIEVGEKVELKAPPGAHDKYGVVKKIIDGRRSINYLIKTKSTTQVLARERFWKISNAKNTKKVSSTTTSSSDNNTNNSNNNYNNNSSSNNNNNIGPTSFMSVMRKQQLMLRQTMK